MNSSSNSDSDSDGEPNSYGARVFWGNLKTPERSRAKFVNPPQTVVKPQHSGRTTTELSRMDNTPDPDVQEAMSEENNGETPNATRLREDMVLGIQASTLDMNIQRTAIQQRDAAGVDNPHQVDEPSLPTILPSQSLSTMLKARASEAGSESEVEDAAVLQLSSPTNVFVDDAASTEACGFSGDTTVARSNSLSPMPSSWKSAVDVSQASQLPDLISFDTTTPTRLPPTNPALTPPRQSDSVANEPTASFSCASVDNLLVLSDQSPITPSPSTSYIQSSEPQQVISNLTPTPPGSEPTTSIEDHSSIDMQSSSVQRPTFPDQLFGEPLGLPGANELLLQEQAPQIGSIHHEVEAVPVVTAKPDVSQTREEARVHTPKPLDIAVTHTPRAETRKRTMTKASSPDTEKVVDGTGSSEESSNTSNEASGSKYQDEMSDKAIKKERRAKAKQEAERRRPLLMSLSPTSADVLDLLASPGRDSPFRSSSRRGVVASGPALADTVSQPNGPTTPTAGPSTPARRIPLTLVSSRPLDIRSFRLDPPAPVQLDDPNRTPARRVPHSSSNFQIQPRILPLNDPNRTPARRVPAVVSTTPTKRPGVAAAPGSQARPAGSQVTSSSASPMKAASAAIPPQVKQPPEGTDLASLSEAPRFIQPLPFTIVQQQQPGEERSDGNSSEPASVQVTVNSPSKPVPPASLRQQSSVSASKIARVANKPYSRPGNVPSRLPKPTSSRLPVFGAGSGTTASGSSQMKINLPSAITPTRIPSPVKKQLPSVDICEPAASTQDPSVVSQPKSTSYQRKRQRMMSEDGDSDEPPAKRPAIVVRQVKRGMFNKTANSNPAVPGPSTSHREISLVRHLRPPGPLRIRQVIPGTLGHFETTRSSSRDLLKNTEEQSVPITEDPPADPVPGPSTPPRGGSPMVETDTASTVTTLSREPTLEDLPSSSSGIGPEPSFATLAESGLRRTTRVRKPYGPDAQTVTSASTRHDPLPLTRTTTLVQRSASSSSKPSKSTTRIAKTPGIPMNQRQLQALTQANTVRNQVYIAELQRQVVRKDGPRPASPTTKVRTILEKAKEANAKGREVRAERRRRRGEGSGMSTNSEGDSLYFDDVSSSPPRDVLSEVPNKHVRGPGDDEDYETPLRVPKPSRLNPDKFSKNVKWDRSLARSASVFAAEQAAKRAREDAAAAEAIRKGCLAQDPKTLRLDPLGNVPEADKPLDNLGKERVVVTRFVYDDDEDIEATRVSKKKKS